MLINNSLITTYYSKYLLYNMFNYSSNYTII